MAFYVYLYTDPTKGDEPFYVGKGTNNRCFSHLKRKDNHPVNRIKLLESVGIKPDITKIMCSSEEIAFNLEIGLISKIGRKNVGLGPLMNLTDGGDCPPKKFGKENYFYGKKPVFCGNRKGIKLSDEVKQKISISTTGRASSSGMSGKHHSFSTIEKIKNSNKNSSVGRGKTWIKDESTGKRIWIDKIQDNS